MNRNRTIIVLRPGTHNWAIYIFKFVSNKYFLAWTASLCTLAFVARFFRPTTPLPSSFPPTPSLYQHSAQQALCITQSTSWKYLLSATILRVLHILLNSSILSPSLLVSSSRQSAWVEETKTIGRENQTPQISAHTIISLIQRVSSPEGSQKNTWRGVTKGYPEVTWQQSTSKRYIHLHSSFSFSSIVLSYACNLGCQWDLSSPPQEKGKEQEDKNEAA